MGRERWTIVAAAVMLTVLATLMASVAHAQPAMAGIVGEIVSLDGSPIHMGSVTLLPSWPPIILPVSASGGFGIEGLPPGEYTLVANVRGNRSEPGGTICLGAGEVARPCIASQPRVFMMAIEPGRVRENFTRVVGLVSGRLIDSRLGEIHLAPRDLERSPWRRIFVGPAN
jgi:hypothetical protein